MKVTILLADYAQGSPGGKANAIGLGWTEVPGMVPPHTVLLLVELDPDDLGVRHHFDISLTDGLGKTVADSAGDDIKASVDLEVARQRNGPPATVPVIAPIAVTITSVVPLEPGVYKWLASVSSYPGIVWNRAFAVHSIQAGELGVS